MAEIISRAGAEQRRKELLEDAVEAAITKINEEIPKSFVDGENFGVQIDMRPEVRARVLQAFDLSPDWKTIGHVGGILHIRSKKK